MKNNNKITTDEICFSFKKRFKLADRRKTLWKIDEKFPISYGTLIIYFQGSCKKLDIYINDSKNSVVTLNPGESFSRTLSDLRSVEIFGYGNDGKCCGCVGIITHYKDSDTEIKINYVFIALLFILLVIIFCNCRLKYFEDCYF